MGATLDRTHPQARGLVAFFLENEGAGKLVYDLAIPGRTSTIPAAAVWQNSVYGPQLLASTTVTQSCTFSSNPALASGAVSYEVLYLHGASIAGFAGLLMTASEGAGFAISNNHFNIDQGAGTSNTTALVVGTYYHEVFVVDGSGTNRYYLNGVADGTDTTSGISTTLTFTNWLGDGIAVPTSSSIVYWRLWNRALLSGEAMALFTDPFGMVAAPGEAGHTYAVLGSRPLAAPSPVLSAALVAGSRPAVAPFPNLAVLASPPAGGIVSGSVSFISNSVLAESAQLVAPATVQANSVLAEAAQVRAPATVQSNSVLAESLVQLLAPATVQSNSLLAESVQIVETTADLALVQANSALALPTAQVVDPSIPVQSNSVLNVTGGLAGQGGGTIIANSALAEAAQIVAPATVQSNSALAAAAQLRTVATPQANSVLQETVAQVVAPAVLQSNSLLSVTGGLAGGGFVQGGVSFASSSALVQQPAQLRTLATLQANSVLSVTPQGTGPTTIVVTDAPLWATALADAPLWATALTDAPLAATGLGDAGTAATSVADTPLVTTILTDA
jgi:hypothetical protein